MADLVFVGIALAFFGLCFLYVLACERIVGRETPVSEQTDPAVRS